MEKPMIENMQPLVEGLLFIAGDDGLTVEDIAKVCELTHDDVVELLANITQRYDDDSYGFCLTHYGDIYKFLSKPFVAHCANKLFTQIEGNYLSQAALEVLSIIAYKQPITRVEIEEIRGVGCDMMIRKLMARDLVEEAGRSEAAGRPFLYQVTQHFMDCFKLVSLDELPQLPQFDGQTDNMDLFSQSNASEAESNMHE